MRVTLWQAQSPVVLRRCCRETPLEDHNAAPTKHARLQRITKPSLWAAFALLSLCCCDSANRATPVDADFGQFAGRYRVNLVFLDSDCPFQLRSQLMFLHSVTQLDQAIVVDSGAAVFQGAVNASPRGFSVTRRAFDSGCLFSQALTYDTASPGDVDFKVTFTQDAACSLVSCTVRYAGDAKRQ
jgi:hypothetical protein